MQQTTLLYLRFENDTLDEALAYKSLRNAKSEYERVAQELYRYGQGISATIHMAQSPETLDEYPDLVLTFDGKRVRTEST
jgi:hypothetical protein